MAPRFSEAVSLINGGNCYVLIESSSRDARQVGVMLVSMKYHSLKPGKEIHSAIAYKCAPKSIETETEAGAD